MSQGGAKDGPYTFEHIQHYLNEGKITGETYAFWRGLKDWGRVKDIPGIEIKSPSTVPPVVVNPESNFGSMVPEEKKDMLIKILEVLNREDQNLKAPEDLNKGIIEGPACVRFLIEREDGVVDERVIRSMLPQLKTALHLSQRHEINLANDRGIWLEVPKEDEKRTFVKCSLLWKMHEATGCDQSKDFHIPIGVDLYGKPVAVKFSDDSAPHLLIGGATGSGKSVALNTIIEGMKRYYEPDDLAMFLIDPKMVELADYATLPHVKGNHCTEADKALDLLEEAVSEMDYRYRTFLEKGQGTEEGIPRKLSDYNSRFPEDRKSRWVLIIDEYADLLDGAGGDMKSKMEIAVKRICQKGRAAGIHVILCTQKASAQILPTVIRDNFQARLGLKMADANASRMIVGNSGAETITGQGEAIYKDGTGEIKRIQIAIVDAQYKIP